MAMLKQSALEEQNGFSIMLRLLSRRSRPKPGEAKLREPLLPLMLLILMVLTLVHSLQDFFFFFFFGFFFPAELSSTC